MREIGKALLLVMMWLAFAGNVLLALFLLGRVLSGLVSRLHTRVRGPAHLNRPGGRATVLGEPWTRRITSVGGEARSQAHASGDARPSRENVEAQAAGGSGGEARAA
jgi:hypothetical protein